MQIQINTDGNIEGSAGLSTYVEGVVESSLSGLRDRITRIEVHLSDQNGDKRGQYDKRCKIEARLEGRQPTVVTHEAASVDEAVEGAADKLKRSLETILAQLQDARRS